MKILKGNYGECRFIDNMDEVHGLPSLEEKNWDLCLTDPPYNLNWKPSGTKLKRISYKDDMSPEEYFEFSKNWYNAAKLASQRVIFTPGYANHAMWYKIDKFDYIIHCNMKANGGSRVAHYRKFEPILVNFPSPIPAKFLFGTLTHHYSMPEYRKIQALELSHSCAKLITLWEDIIKQMQPQSVIDPFLGSGTTAQVCETLGIPWLGYEIMGEYSVDIEKRIKKGINDHKYRKKQTTLNSLIKKG